MGRARRPRCPSPPTCPRLDEICPACPVPRITSAASFLCAGAAVLRRTPHRISELSPVKNTHSFCRCLKLMTAGDRWNTDWLINCELCRPARLPLHHIGLVQCPQCCGCPNTTPVHLTLHFHIACRGSDSPAIQRQQSTIFRRRTKPSDLEVLTLLPATSDSAVIPAHAEGHRLVKPTEPHHKLKAKMQFWGSQIMSVNVTSRTETNTVWLGAVNKITDFTMFLQGL